MRSEEAQKYRYLYKTAKWIKSRLRFLRKHPLCVFCQEHDGRYVPATIVDHKKPHKGNLSLFWDENNWQSLCKPCHDGRKQRMEKNDDRPTTGLDGWPVD